MPDTWVQSLGQEDPLEKGMATHSSILAWRIPWTDEPRGLQSMRSQRIGHRCVTNTFVFIKLSLRLLVFQAFWPFHQISGVSTGHISPSLAPSQNAPCFAVIPLVKWKVKVSQSCLTLCYPMDCNMPGFPVLHQLPELTQTHFHWVSDAIQPSHPVISFSSCLQFSPASGSFVMSQFFASGGQRTGVLASVLPMYIQDAFPLGWTGLISLLSEGLSRILVLSVASSSHESFGPHFPNL